MIDQKKKNLIYCVPETKPQLTSILYGCVMGWCYTKLVHVLVLVVSYLMRIPNFWCLDFFYNFLKCYFLICCSSFDLISPFKEISSFLCNILQHLNLWRKSLKLIPICLAQWLVGLLTANSGIETWESRYFVIKYLCFLFRVAVFAYFSQESTWSRSILDLYITEILYSRFFSFFENCILENSNASDGIYLFRMGILSLHSIV